MRTVYVRPNYQEQAEKDRLTIFSDGPVEFIPVPGMNIAWLDNSLATQTYLRERGLESLIRPLEGAEYASRQLSANQTAKTAKNA
jgi:hypothetical protein